MHYFINSESHFLGTSHVGKLRVTISGFHRGLL